MNLRERKQLQQHQNRPRLGKIPLKTHTKSNHLQAAALCCFGVFFFFQSNKKSKKRFEQDPSSLSILDRTLYSSLILKRKPTQMIYNDEKPNVKIITV